MKKGLAILIVLFPVVTNFLWADFVYDNVVTQSKFSYSIGVKYGVQVGGLPIDFSYYNEDSSKQENITGWFNDMYASLYYQADWRYFILGIMPFFRWQNLSAFENRYIFGKYITQDGSNSSDQQIYGFNTQFLFRLPLVNMDYTIALFAGPEVTISMAGAINLIGGLDLGFRLTKHHFLFLNAGVVISTRQEPVGMGNVLSKLHYDSYRNNGGMPIGMQLSIGIRTKTYQRTYYYKDIEVGRGR